MKVVLLAGGLGTRLREETEFRPKPMVAIGTRPILWHIMKTYAHYGHREFVICLGYKGDVIRDYFLNYEVRHRDVTVTLGSRDVQVHGSHAETGWSVTLAETGETTRTGGRLGRVARFLLDGERFMVTYGDGVADIDLGRLLEFHRAHGKLATLTAVRPSSRFGEVVIDNDMVQVFQDQRRLLHLRARRAGHHRRRRGEPRAVAADQAHPHEAARGLPAHRLLAVHGHAARDGAAERPVAAGQGRLGRLAMNGHP
jgi:glucose-1-phosphate cytidylyltransferase